MKRSCIIGCFCLFILVFCLPLLQTARAEVMLQWFETEWEEMYRRLPELAETGYAYVWAPPPTKAPTGQGTKWGNVGYSLYDRFDLGDIPQRGSLDTRYGTRGDLRNLVDNMHQCDVKIIPDIVMNHNGNGPDFRSYPGMASEDFHVEWSEYYCNSLNYKRAPRMDQWYHDNGYGGTMWQDLCSLVDIRTEDNPTTRGDGSWNRFTGGNNTPGYNFVTGTSYLRHVGEYDKYPYYPSGYTNESASEMLYRWIAWLGEAMDYDGLRLDAGKHTPWEFFGDDYNGFLHEAQYNQSLRRGFTNYNDTTTVFENYIDRDHSLIFAEILSPWSEIEYWADHNPMRFLDYQIKKTADDALNGNIGGFNGYGKDFGPNNGVMYVWGHDEGPASKVDLGYAYILTHIGFPMVYFTGKNIIWDDKGTRTWMIPGYDGYALGDDGNKIANLVWIHNNFAWGKEWSRWVDGDILAYERYDDLNSSDNPDSGEGILLVALNDSGWDKSITVDTCFAEGTELKDYTGNGANVWVSSGQVSITIPGNSGQGWVCYAPTTPEVTVSFSSSVDMDWIVPGGIHGSDKPGTIPRITSSSFDVDATLSESVGHTLLKWGTGKDPVGSGTHYTNDSALIRANFEDMGGSGTSWSLSISDAGSKIPEGLNTVKVRAYKNWPGDGAPTLFNTATKVVYIDLQGPEIDVTYPASNGTIRGDAVMQIENPDFTAYGMTVALDGGSSASAHEVMKGLWRFNLTGLSEGGHTAVVTTTEADWNSPRAVINTSIYTHVFTVQNNSGNIAISHSEGDELQLPFFETAVTVDGTPDEVRLYWDGYELPFNGGNYTNIFNNAVVYRDNHGRIETNMMWGNFVNGQHFFEAIRVDAGVTSRATCRVVFDLYNGGHIDSDGDAIPDNVEMPFIDSDGAPGADAPWPGDSNQNFIPESWETWTRLNPYNHSTFYNGQWDDQNDFDGDGYSNYEEVYAGYAYSNGNIYAFSIYDASIHPTGSITNRPASVLYNPDPAQREVNFNITFSPNQGVLQDATNVYLHIGHSKRTMGDWQDVQDIAMTPASTNWTASYMVPSNATSVDFCFTDGDALWENNNGNDWQVTVQGSIPDGFVMDGHFDSEGYLVCPDAMKIYAAVKGSDLYLATWSTEGNDNIIYVTDQLGDALSTPCQKAGVVFFTTSEKPFLMADGNDLTTCLHNVTGVITNGVRGDSQDAFEGSFSLLDSFGYIPEAIYVASVSYGPNDDGTIQSQTPIAWESGDDVNITEFQRLVIDNLRDDDGDGYFEAGAPYMWTSVNGSSNDANYGLLRYFINELANEQEYVTVTVAPNPGGTNEVSDVELFSNLNRRDFAVMPGDEDPDTVTTGSDGTYYAAYTMTNNGDGSYSYTLPVYRCGAYRINARYRVNGGSYSYYTDHGLRRDCAVVVSPTKTLDVTMYELNPMIAEAQDNTFFGRSTFEDMYMVNTSFVDRVSTTKLNNLGMNMIWLQPIHPIGTEGRQNDPLTGSPYDPGSPYAVRNYWKVNSVLGDPSTEDQAMTEFTNFVQALDGSEIGVMLDGTFNHSAWDCQVGQPGVDMFDWTTNATDYIRDVRPAWYSKEDYYNDVASHYGNMSEKDIAPAPDRIDFGKWYDAADFHFGTYDCLVQQGPTDTNWSWSSRWYHRYLFEYDYLEPFETNATRELWEYFAYYPQYWLEKTGHPVGTPKEESYKGIDGLRCDFAQGLPSLFWEYCINKTRSIKWDFLFMAESLDGFKDLNGDKHHGVGYRSARHFDILNENMVYHWRDSFFNDFMYGQPITGTPDRRTTPTQDALDNRKTAFANVPILLNLTSHDEILPSAHQPSMLYAYATVSSVAGVPLIMYGQEAGAQNDLSNYTNAPNYGYNLETANNFGIYELNFGKSIPNFKRYNCMTSVWFQGYTYMSALEDSYGRVSRARLRSPALRSQSEYFLSTTNGWKDEDIFALAKFEAPGVPAASQDVVFVFVNNNCQASTNRGNIFDVSADYNGDNWFGIESTHNYNVVDLASANPTNRLWGTDKPGSEILNDGLYVGLNGNIWEGGQLQYLKLIDVAATYPTDSQGNYDGSNYSNWDWDNDGLENQWEIDNGLDPHSAIGTNGASGDRDGDGMSNEDEYLAGTLADDPQSLLQAEITINGSNVEVSWGSTPGIQYRMQSTDSLLPGEASWQTLYFGSAMATNKAVSDSLTSNKTNQLYRVSVQP